MVLMAQCYTHILNGYIGVYHSNVCQIDPTTNEVNSDIENYNISLSISYHEYHSITH